MKVTCPNCDLHFAVWREAEKVICPYCNGEYELEILRQSQHIKHPD
jgi:uncharacterized Zn-finger protein